MCVNPLQRVFLSQSVVNTNNSPIPALLRHPGLTSKKMINLKLEVCEIPSLALVVNELEFMHLRVQVKKGQLEPFYFSAVINGEKIEGSVDPEGRVVGTYPFTALDTMLFELM